MSKPVPKPRPPPKPHITALNNKPPLRPKPRRPPPVPKKDITSDQVTLPERPFKPAHLSIKNNSCTPNNSEAVTVAIDEDLYDDVVVESSKGSGSDEENIYDDLIFDDSDNLGDNSSDSSKPPPPRKPLPTLPVKKESPEKAVKDGLTVKPIPVARTSPQPSPVRSPRDSRSPRSESHVTEGKTAIEGAPDEKNHEQTSLTKERSKPPTPPKPEWLRADSKQNKSSSTSEGTAIEEQAQAHFVENELYSDKVIFNELDVSPCTGDQENEKSPVRPIKKRIATRRHNPGKTAAIPIVKEEKKRRPPPPPPESDEGSPPKRGGSLKGPSVKGRLEVNDGLPKAKSTECIPKKAEEQSLYSYAYEHTLLPTPLPTPVKSSDNVNTEEDDASYVEPDSATVAGFMEAINSKDECVSDGTYEIPEREIQDENSDESSSDSEHDYETPCDSPPPVPSRRCGSYEVTSPDEWDEDEAEDEEDEDGDEDEDEDHEGDYVEPPDALQPPGSSDDNMFLDDEANVEAEPLYQVYTARTLQRDRTLSRKISSQNESSLEDITKGTLRNMRMLWCELPEVLCSGILERIDTNERKRQEAMFEVITSEASYLKSLKILKDHFISSPELTPGSPQSVIEKAQYHTLFSNVDSVVEMSQKYLDALRQRSKESLVVSSISDIILEFASKHFEVYVKYCSNQIHQDRVLKDLRKSPRYLEGIEKLEKSAAAQCLSLQSFLVLPMQRITRLPLLVDAICHRCEAGSDEFMKTDAALKAVHKVVRDCNEGARKMERMEEMLALRPQIEFTGKPIALVSSNRWLLRRGEVVLVIEQFKSPISKKKLKLKPVYMFLFNDLLLITKKKGENRYRVLDYAFRNMTKVEESTDSSIQLEHMLSLILLENCNNKTKDFLLCAESETDKTRWLEAFNPPKAEREGEKVYGDWDCPQVQAIHSYTPQQPDELALHEGDVINVQRKLPDGWHYGERLCDGICGWFPANYTENILNEHVRARNLLQRYRLLAASKHLIGAVQTMKTSKTSKLTLKSISATLQDRKRETIS